MDPNTHSTDRPPRPDGLATVAAGIDQLAADDLDRLPDAVVAEQPLALRQLLDRLNGLWLQRLAVTDGRGEPVLLATARRLDPPRTDLPNLALWCRAHHRAVHEGGWEGGWRLTRAPDGRFTATPPHRRSRRHPGHHRRHAAFA